MRCLDIWFLLLWKNWIFRKRNFLLTIAEILLLPLFIVILILSTTFAPGANSKNVPETIFPEFHDHILLPRLKQEMASCQNGCVIAYAPNRSDVRQIMENLKSILEKPSNSSVNDNPFIGKNPAVLHDFGSEQDLMDAHRKWQINYKKQLLIGIIFGRTAAPEFSYTLRFSPMVDIADKPIVLSVGSDSKSKPMPGPGRFTDFYLKFSALQIQIDRILIRRALNANISSSYNGPTMSLQAFPYPPYKTLNVGTMVTSETLVFVTPLGFVMIIVSLMRGLVTEKETGFKALVNLMGVSNWLHLLAWFCTSLVISLIAICLVTCELVIPFNSERGAVISAGDPSLILAIFFVYILQGISLTFFMAAFFQRAVLAIIAVTAVWLLLSFMPILLGDGMENMPFLLKMFLCLLPNVAFNIAMTIYMDMERMGEGGRWRYFYERIDSAYDMCLADVFLVMGISFFGYIFLSVYVERIIPTKFGVRKPFYYIFMPSEWYGSKKNAVNPQDEDKDDKDEHQKEPRPSRFEKEPTDLEADVVILNLRKVYGKAKNGKVAVDGVTLKMFHGQITVLLGQNGAGKSSLMGILTGMQPASSGTALINGFNVTKDLALVQKDLSFCPQNNMQLNEFTVKEHFIFFTRLKGVGRKKAEEEAIAKANDLGLKGKIDVPVKNLSGGQKRRVQLGIALVGGSKVVFLDEPTSGLDPESRREIWDILLDVRRNRTICLTTHFMEEAEILGDRIAIMEAGRIKCSGTPIFLKNYYGTGYTLHVTLDALSVSSGFAAKTQSHTSFFAQKDSDSFKSKRVQSFQSRRSLNGRSRQNSIFARSNQGNQSQQILNAVKSMTSTTTAFTGNAVAVLALVQKHVRSAFFKSRFSRATLSIEITLPSDSTMESGSKERVTSKFPALFEDLYTNKKSLGIENFSLSITTMDDVFTAVTSGSKKDGKNLGQTQSEGQIRMLSREGSGVISLASRHNSKFFGREFDQNEPKEAVSDFKLTTRQFRALLIKNFHARCNRKILLCIQILFPIIITIIAIAALNSNYKMVSPEQPKQVQLSSFDQSITLFSSNNSDMSASFLKVVGKSGKTVEVKDFDQGLQLHDKLLKIGKDNLIAYRRKYIVAAELSKNHVKALFSTVPKLAAPLTINLASNTILKYSATKNSPTIIKVVNHPLEMIGGNALGAVAYKEDLRPYDFHTYGYLLVFGLGILHATFIVGPLEERHSKAKQLQMMTGVQPFIYWASFFLWDFALCLIVIPIMIACFFALQGSTTIMTSESAVSFFIAFVAFSFAAILFHYFLALLLKSVPCGFGFAVIIQVVLSCCVALLSILSTVTDMPTLGGIIEKTLKIFPIFTASTATMVFLATSLANSRCDLITKDIKRAICSPSAALKLENRACCDNCKKDFPKAPCFSPKPYLVWEVQNKKGFDLFGGETSAGMVQDIVALLTIGFIYLFLIFAIEYKFKDKILDLCSWRKRRAENMEFRIAVRDDSVLREQDRTTHDGSILLALKRVCKHYQKTFAALSNVSFGVEPGECFGLLGVNGAGKTTLFKILTGDEDLTFGDISAYLMRPKLESESKSESASESEVKKVDQVSLTKHRKKYLASIGYCPQFDAFLPSLTGRQMLQLFSRLRGSCGERVNLQADRWLEKFGLTTSGNVHCGKYSGGMQRRLSAAMAMIEDPAILLLDEPSSGVDPTSTRQFWRVISSLVNDCDNEVGVRVGRQAIVLTSHSMNECEALCSRLAIMVNGQIQCLGGVDELKTRFAQGLSLEIKLKPSNISSLKSKEIDLLCKNIEKNFIPCALKERHQTLLHYALQNTELRLDYVFSVMETEYNKPGSIIEEYSVSETTLEQVFLQFAHNQNYPERTVRLKSGKSGSGCCC